MALKTIKGVGTTLQLQVIDVAARSVVGERTFEACTLPTSQTRSVGDKSDILASGDNAEIIAWVRALPRR